MTRPFTPHLSARELRRLQQRRPTAQRTKVNPKNALNPIARSTAYTEEEAATLANEVRISWHQLSTGEGDLADFENLVIALNVITVLSEKIHPDLLATAKAAQLATLGIKNRYLRIKKLGVDARALADIPPALDLYDELLRNSTPHQMTAALSESVRRQKTGNVLTEERAA